MKFFTLIVCTIFICNFTYADFPAVKVEKFSADYTDPEGSGFAHLIQYEDISLAGENFSILRQGGTLFISSESTYAEIPDLPAEIDQLQSFGIGQFDFESLEKTFVLRAEDFKGESTEEQDISVGKVYATCTGTEEREEMSVELLDACLNKKSQFMISRLVLKEGGDTTTLDGATFKIEENNLNFWITKGMQIRGNGKIWYEGDKVRIRIDRAKVKFLNVKKRLFKELKALEKESENITVNNPWIEIRL